MLDGLMNLLKKNELIRDNFVFFWATMAANALGYFFHFYMGRVLTVVDYGILGSLLSLVYFLVVSFTTIQTSLANYISKFKVKREYGKISYLLYVALKKLFLYGIIFLVCYLVISPFIASFLYVPVKPVMLLGIFLLFSFLISVVRGGLQGLQRFKDLGWVGIVDGISKLGLGIILVTLGFGVSGAVLAFGLSYVLGFSFGIYFLRKVFREKREKFHARALYKYSVPMLVMILSLTAFYTVDIILVKHFFSEGSVEAGYYAALSLLGKIIFFATYSVSMVMFPKVSALWSMNKPHKNIYRKSLLFVATGSIIITLIYFFLPQIVVGITYGKDYFPINNLLGLFGVFMTLFSLVYLISFYHISLHRTKFIYILILFNILEIGAIWFFHASLLQVVLILIGITLLLFLILLFITAAIKDGSNIAGNPSIQ